MVNWSELTFFVLVSIFQFLSPQDRFQAGQVCSSWRKVCEYAGLWRDLCLHIRRDLCEQSPPIKIFLTKYGHLINKLSVVGDHCYRNSRYCNRPANGFWIYLSEAGLQLQHVCFQNWKSEQPFVPVAGRWHLEFLTFIRSQKQLKSLAFKNVHLNSSEWMTLLEALRGPRDCKNLIKSLTIVGGLPEFQSISSHPSYLISLSKLVSLRHLSLDYSLCSDRVLFVLAEGVCGCLETFGITYTKPITVGLSDRAWAALLVANPLLQVNCNFKCSCVDPNIFLALNSRMPLKSLKFSCASSQDPKRFSVKQFIEKVICSYKHSIENFELRVRDNDESLDKKLVSIMQNCSRLESFHFSGVIRKMTTIWQICEFLLNNPERFQTFYNRPKFLNYFNCTNIKENYGIYKKMLREKEVRLYVEDPSSRFSF